MKTSVPVAEIKSHFSDYVSKSSYKNERFIITRRNKPVAALVSMDDLQLIEQEEKRKGLTSIIGKWKNFDEIADALTDISLQRKREGEGRDVSI